MVKFSFDDVQDLFSSLFEEAGFEATYFIYEPLAMETYLRGITKDKQPVYLVVWTTPDEYLTNAIIVLSREEYEKEYTKYLNDPEYDVEGEGGNPDTPDSEYSPIDWGKLKKILTYCGIDLEAFKEAIKASEPRP
jgi:hypothetical protein